MILLATLPVSGLFKARFLTRSVCIPVSWVPHLPVGPASSVVPSAWALHVRVLAFSVSFLWTELLGDSVLVAFSRGAFHTFPPRSDRRTGRCPSSFSWKPSLPWLFFCHLSPAFPGPLSARQPLDVGVVESLALASPLPACSLPE